MVCNGCGRIISDDAEKCDFCYTEVEKIDVEKYKKSFMPKRNVKELTITFFLILILVVIGFVLYKNITNFTSGEGLNERKTVDNNTVNPTNTPIDTIDTARNVVDEYNKKIENMDRVLQ